MKILSRCPLFGVECIKFCTDLGRSKNHNLLEEIHFPSALIPESYLCSVQCIIMSMPQCIEGVEMIDAGALTKHIVHQAHQPGFTAMTDFIRQPLKHSYTIETELAFKIITFVKKTQLIYYLFQENNSYQTCYNDPVIKGWLYDESLPYDDFKNYLIHFSNTQRNQACSGRLFKASEPDTKCYPPFELCHLFVVYQIPALKPSKKDYELLLRRIAGQGDADALYKLLYHPVFDAMLCDPDAQSTNGLSAVGWAKKRLLAYPARATNYEECIKILDEYQKKRMPQTSCGI